MSDDPKAPTQDNVPSRRVAALSDPSSPAGTPSAVAAATLTDSDDVEDSAPRARGGGPFRAITDWLAPAVAGDALRRMDRGIDGDVYLDVLGTHPGLDPTSLSLKIAQERLADVDRHLKALRGSPALRTLVDALAKPGRLDRVRSSLATEAAKTELDARVLAVRARARLDEVWRAIEPQFAADALFDWAEQRLHRENGIAKTLSDPEWRATLERVSVHEVVIKGERVRVRVQSHEDWIRAAIEEELRGTTLVSPRKADLWIDDLSSTIKLDAARALVEQAIANAGGRVGEVASANPLMNVRGRAVASPDALVALCAENAEIRAEVRERLKNGRLSALLENWIDGVEETERKRPRELLAVLTWAEATWKGRDPDMGLQAFLWAAGEARLTVGEQPVTTLRELVAVVDARAARLTPLMSSGALELWLRYALANEELATLARVCASQNEIGAYTFLWAAGEKRLRLGRTAVSTVEELCAAVTREDRRRAVKGSIADGLLREWLARAQDRADLVGRLDATLKLSPDTAVWAIAYAGGLAELDLGEGVSVATLAELSTWLRGHLHAFADRFDESELVVRLRYWLEARGSTSSRERLRSHPRKTLHDLLRETGVREVWLTDDVVVPDGVALADALAADPSRVAAGVTDQDRAEVLALLAPDPRALMAELKADRSTRLRTAAVVRCLDPKRPIAVAGHVIANDDARVLASHVLSAIDRSRLWTRMDEARLVVQELQMVLRARSAKRELEQLRTALKVTSPIAGPIALAELSPADLLRAAFAFHDGPRPFRPSAEDEVRTITEMGWYFAKNPGRWDEELVATERNLWLAQEARTDLLEKSLPEFLFAVFPERSASAVEILEATPQPGAIVVSWALSRSLVLLEDGATTPAFRHDATAPQSFSSQLPKRRLFARRETQVSELCDALLHSIEQQVAIERARITNLGDLPPTLAAKLRGSEGSGAALWVAALLALVAVVVLGAVSIHVFVVAAGAFLIWLFWRASKKGSAPVERRGIVVTRDTASELVRPEEHSQVVDVGAIAFHDLAQTEAAARKTFAAWAGRLPAAPNDVDALINGLQLRLRSVGRLVSVIDERHIAWRTAACMSREPIGTKPSDPDPWLSPDLVRSQSRYIKSCGSCQGSGQVGCGRCGGSSEVACGNCGGSGKAYGYAKNGSRRLMNCKSCDKTGRQRCGVCSGGRVTCETCAGGGRFESWAEVVESPRRYVLRAQPDDRVIQAFGWGRDGFQASTAEIAADARVVFEANCEDGPLRAAQAAAAVGHDWVTANWAPMEPVLGAGARVVRQSFALLEIPAVTVSYGIGDEWGVVEFEGQRLLAPPSSADKVFRRRARFLAAAAVLLAAAPLARAWKLTGTVFQAPLVIAGAAALAMAGITAFIALRNATLNRSGRRWAIATAIPIAAAVALAIVSEPRLEHARASLVAGRVTDAELELRSLGPEDAPELAELWAELRLEQMRRVATLSEKQAIAAKIPATLPQRAAAQELLDAALVVAAQAKFDAGNANDAKELLLQVRGTMGNDRSYRHKLGLSTIAHGRQCLASEDWVCAADEADAASEANLYVVEEAQQLRADTLAALRVQTESARLEKDRARRMESLKRAAQGWSRLSMHDESAAAALRLVRAQLERDERAQRGGRR